MIVISRYLLAQSFDRFLPAKVSFVSPRFGSPVIAHAIDLVFTISLVGLASYYFAGASSLFGAIAGSMIYFVFVRLAAVLPARQNEMGGGRTCVLIAGVWNRDDFS